MGKLFVLIGRYIKIYLRDKSAVFFSFLTMLIIIGLMVLFLGDNNVKYITEILSAFPGRDEAKDKENAKLLVLIWTCAGIIPVNSITVAASSLSFMIKDKSQGKINSIYTSPISKSTISVGYVLSTCLSSMFICILSIAVSEIYCIIKGAEPFSILVHLQLFGMTALSSFTFSAFAYFMTSFAKTEGAWGSIETVIGTLMSFVGGIYLPIGSLSENIAGVLKCTPVIYSTSMFREIMTKDILKKTFEDIPEDIILEYSQAMGITLTLNDKDISLTQSCFILLSAGIQ